MNALDNLNLARRDPASAGIFYATVEAQERHEAALDELEQRERKVERLIAAGKAAVAALSMYEGSSKLSREWDEAVADLTQDRPPS